MVGDGRFELPTSCVSCMRSNLLILSNLSIFRILLPNFLCLHLYNPSIGFIDKSLMKNQEIYMITEQGND